MPGKERDDLLAEWWHKVHSSQASACPGLSSTQQGSEDTLHGCVRADTLGGESSHSSQSHQSRRD